MDTSEEIDQSFGDGPAHRPVAERIVAGRRRVVRRRIGMGACAAGTAVVIGVGAWAFAPGSTPSTDPAPMPIATRQTQDRSDQSSDGRTNQKRLDPQSTLMKGVHAAYGPDGELVIRKGWRITQRIPNPYGVQPPNKSVGLELTKAGKAYWYVVDYQPDGGSSVSDPAGKGFATLNAWVADQVELQQGNQPPTPVEFRGDTAELVAANGATIVRQRPDPDVPGFARPGDTTAVAQVQWKGATYFVLARQTAGSGETDYFPMLADVPPRPTMKSFLDYTSKQYSSGEGLR